MLEEPQKVAVLAVYVAADLNGRLKLEQCRLSCQDRCTLLKQICELVSAQVHVGARFLCRTHKAPRQAGRQHTHGCWRGALSRAARSLAMTSSIFVDIYQR